MTLQTLRNADRGHQTAKNRQPEEIKKASTKILEEVKGKKAVETQKNKAKTLTTWAVHAMAETWRCKNQTTQTLKAETRGSKNPTN